MNYIKAQANHENYKGILILQVHTAIHISMFSFPFLNVGETYRTPHVYWKQYIPMGAKNTQKP